ncbi:MAG: D-alanine--D-alanine ligase family protein [Bacteroidota bacterium]|nr:D-alanine--D-alanine ligase family protein [Bacteroidota bacterium]
MKSKIKNRKSKIRVGVIFGGRSAEHEVSLVSTTSIINFLDKNKYQVIPIGISPDGRWFSSTNVLDAFKKRKYNLKKDEVCLLPDPSIQGLIRYDGKIIPLDVIFPVLHGSFGEDGTIQGLIELANIAFVGAGVLGSSIGMDKITTKQLCEQAGISVAPYVWFITNEYSRNSKKILMAIENKLGYPCFIKPANLGSSVGISKAHNWKQLIAAIKLAFKYDRKILVEKSIEDAREIEVSILGNDNPIASVPGEIISSNEFYDYDAKYIDGKSEAVIPANLPPSITKKVREVAIRSFKAIDCAGMARVDFLAPRRTNKIYFNEINTIPGFTSISMYPKLWEASGITYPELLDILIQLALQQHREKLKLQRRFHPKKDWHKSK